MEEQDRQETLREEMTETEEAYHAAYPDVRAPIATSILAALFGKDRRGVLAWAVVGLLVAVVLWAAYTRWWL